eukprot:695051-Rhodomonas_salina.3
MNRFGNLWNSSLGLLRAAVPGTQRDMVKLRLQRFGRKNLPFYRVVAADSKSPRDGRCIEYLGTYNPNPNKHNEKLVTLNVEVRSEPGVVCSVCFSDPHYCCVVQRIKYWLVVGAQPTETVAKLLGNCALLPAKPMRHWKEPKVPPSFAVAMLFSVLTLVASRPGEEGLNLPLLV